MEKQKSQPNIPTLAKNPKWWNDNHTSGWNRVKEAMRRDWEQTKADFTGEARGRDLDQDVGDTLKQAAGRAPIPPPGSQNLPKDYEAATKRMSELEDKAQRASERIYDAEIDAAAERRELEQKIEEAKAATAEARADARAKAQEAEAKAREAAYDARVKYADKPQKMDEKIENANIKASDADRKATYKVGDALERQERKIESATDSAARGMERADKERLEAERIRSRARADWYEIEHAVRYGFGARSQYPGQAWDENLEMTLRNEWNTLGSGRSWDDSKAHVRRGWDQAAH